MWNWEYSIKILPSLINSIKITISATIVAYILAVILGLIWAIGRRSNIKVINIICSFIVEFVRSTPLLAQLYFIFYIFPKFGLSLSPFIAGVLGLGLHYSTYLSEVYRSGIEAIPRGQWEAATALNLTRKQTWLKIILPQAIPPIVPVMGNYLIGMFKDTPLLSAITLVELLQRAKIIGSQTFRYLEPFTMVGIIFLILSYISSLGVQRLEIWSNRR
jgi:polar amino acid transport system permease protein